MKLSQLMLITLLVMVAGPLTTLVLADFCDDLENDLKNDTGSLHSRNEEYELLGKSGPTGLHDLDSLLDPIPGLNLSDDDGPVAGIVPSTCDYRTGIKPDGLGRQQCVTFCKDHFRDQDECDGSRCIATDGATYLTGPKQGQVKPGKCYCTCGCPTSDSSKQTDILGR